MRKVTFDNKLLPYLLLAPQLLILFWFFFWPAGQAVYSAFTITDAFGGNTQFVWFQNFSREFTSPEYQKAIGVTLVFSFATTVVALGFGLIFAIAVDRIIRGTSVYRVFVIWPYAVAPAVAGVVWVFTLDPQAGIGTFWIERTFGVEWDPYLNRTHAMILVVVASAWKQISYYFVFFLAGLQAIPKSLIEAAAMDGAGPIRRVRDLLLPLLAPTTFFLVIMNIVYAFFETFGVVAVTTAGRPGDWTSILVYKVFKDGFIGLDYGASAAQSIVLMMAVIGLTILQFRYIERRVHYSG
ncbi:MAG: ABC transporter permease subunit [Geminicoccaceae bacterium]